MAALTRVRRASSGGASRWIPYGVVLVGVIPVIAGMAGLAFVAFVAIAGAGGFLYGFRRWPTHTTIAVFVVSVLEHLAAAYLSGALRSLVKTADEPLVLLLVIATIVYRRHERPAARALVLVPIVGILVSGFFSVLLNRVPPTPAIVGSWQLLKFWSLMYVAVHVPWGRREVDALARTFAGLTLVTLVIGMLNLASDSLFRALIPLAATGEERFGRIGVQSLFTHPGHFGAFATFMSIFFLARFMQSGSRRDLGLAVWCIGLGFLSFRLKVILGFVGAVATLAVAAPQKFFRRLGGALLVLMLGLALFGGMVSDLATTQIDRYLLGDNETLREALYTTAGRIGVDNFPFGEGFGRFGTGAATQFDSPVYDEYGIGGRRGLSREIPAVRHDTTWPTVVGETGWAGFAFFFGGVVAIWLTLLGRVRRHREATARWVPLAGLAVLSSIILESLGRPSFFQAFTTLSLTLLLAAGLCVDLDREPGAHLARRGPLNAVATPERVGLPATPPRPRSEARRAPRARRARPR